MKIHFIGLGGIGVSGLASLYFEKGNKVTGSDLASSEITEILEKQGISVSIGHKEENIQEGIDLVIYSEAIPEDNVELEKARKLGIKCLSGAEGIALFSQDYVLIAVSGMHGKTTTSCMIAKIMVDAGFDPTYIIGTKNGYRLGKSKYLIIEADDYKAKLLNYRPDILVLTNIDEEHMDYFKDLHHIKEVFKEYVLKVKKLIIANENNENVKEVVKEAQCEVQYYSKGEMELSLPGDHNKYNAKAALLVALSLGIDEGIALKSLKEYQGTWRRFEEKEINGIHFISDYAHHPKEIKATLQAAREKYPNKKTWVLFQPHQKQRTFFLFNDFVTVLKDVENLIITDIYDVTGRETEAIKVSSQDLIEKIGQGKYIEKERLIPFLKENVRKGEVVLTMTAGDIYKIVDKFN